MRECNENRECVELYSLIQEATLKYHSLIQEATLKYQCLR